MEYLYSDTYYDGAYSYTFDCIPSNKAVFEKKSIPVPEYFVEGAKYSVEEIGNMFGIGKTKTRELLQSRLLPVTKIGRDYFTSKTAIQDFLNKNVGKELFF